MKQVCINVYRAWKKRKTTLWRAENDGTEYRRQTVNCAWFDKATLREADFLECMLEDADFLDNVGGTQKT
jgi:hypothetical protein